MVICVSDFGLHVFQQLGVFFSIDLNVILNIINSGYDNWEKIVDGNLVSIDFSS